MKQSIFMKFKAVVPTLFCSLWVLGNPEISLAGKASNLSGTMMVSTAAGSSVPFADFIAPAADLSTLGFTYYHTAMGAPVELPYLQFTAFKRNNLGQYSGIALINDSTSTTTLDSSIYLFNFSQDGSYLNRREIWDAPNYTLGGPTWNGTIEQLADGRILLSEYTETLAGQQNQQLRLLSTTGSISVTQVPAIARGNLIVTPEGSILLVGSRTDSVSNPDSTQTKTTLIVISEVLISGNSIIINNPKEIPVFTYVSPNEANPFIVQPRFTAAGSGKIIVSGSVSGSPGNYNTSDGYKTALIAVDINSEAKIWGPVSATADQIPDIRSRCGSLIITDCYGDIKMMLSGNSFYITSRDLRYADSFYMLKMNSLDGTFQDRIELFKNTSDESAQGIDAIVSKTKNGSIFAAFSFQKNVSSVTSNMTRIKKYTPSGTLVGTEDISHDTAGAIYNFNPIDDDNMLFQGGYRTYSPNAISTFLIFGGRRF